MGQIAEFGQTLGLRTWISRREQRRRYKGRPLADLLSEAEQRVYLPLIHPGPSEALEAVDCVWYLRGKATFLWEVEWTAMLDEAVIRRGARIPTTDALYRFLVIPPERTELVRLKLARSPILRARLEEDNWHLIKSDHLVRLLSREDAGPGRPGAAAGAGPGDRTARGAAGAVRLSDATGGHVASSRSRHRWRHGRPLHSGQAGPLGPAPTSEEIRMHHRTLALGATLALALAATAGPAVAAAEMEVAHPAHIHAGTCPAPADVVAPLTDVAPSMAGPAMGQATAVPVGVSVTTVPLTLADIVAAPHAIVVHAERRRHGDVPRVRRHRR